VRTAPHPRLLYQELGDPRLRGIGLQRLAGILAAAGGTGGAVIASRHLVGVTADEDEDARRFLPPWSKNSQILYLVREEGGKLRFIDVGYSDPYSYLKEPVIALLRGEDWKEKLFGAAASVAEPFIGEEILAGKLLDISRNRTTDGRPVFNPEDAWGDQQMDKLAHVWDALESGTLTSLTRIYKGLRGIEEESGRAYDPADEIMAVVSGQRRQVVDVPQSLSFRARDYERRMSDAHRVLTSVATRRGQASEGEIADAYHSMERARQKLFSEMHEDARAAVRLGVPVHEALAILQGAGLSADNASDVLAGMYRPYWPSDRFLASVERAEASLGRGRDGRFAARRHQLQRLAAETTRTLFASPATGETEKSGRFLGNPLGRGSAYGEDSAPEVDGPEQQEQDAHAPQAGAKKGNSRWSRYR
jgi:hypothetical protein